MAPWFSVFTHSLLIQTPTLLLCAAGLVVARVRWSRQPRQSLFVLTGMGLLFLAVVVRTFLQVWLPFHWREAGWTDKAIIDAQPLIGAIGNLGQAVALALLLA